MNTKIFNDIAGQDRTIEYFVRAFENKRLTHAYLISGASEKTRKSLAKRFAYCILADSVGSLANGGADLANTTENLANSVDNMANTTLTDTTQVNITNNQSLPHKAYSDDFTCADLHELKPESAGLYLIDQIRQISSDANLAPIQYKKKVYIFHDVDCLRGAPANALLKTLEEPPADVVCILLAQNYASVLQTLQSRCVLLKLNAEKLQLDQSSDIFELLYKVANRAKSADIFDQVQNIKELAQSKGKDLDEEKEEQLETYKDYFSASARKELDTHYKREARSLEKEEIMHQLLMIRLWLRDCLLLKNGVTTLMQVGSEQAEQGSSEQLSAAQVGSEQSTQEQTDSAQPTQASAAQTNATQQGVRQNKEQLFQNENTLDQITQVSAQCSEKGLLKAIAAVKKCEQEIHYNVGLDIALEAMFFEIRRALCQ